MTSYTEQMLSKRCNELSSQVERQAEQMREMAIEIHALKSVHKDMAPIKQWQGANIPDVGKLEKFEGFCFVGDAIEDTVDKNEMHAKSIHYICEAISKHIKCVTKKVSRGTVTRYSIVVETTDD